MKPVSDKIAELLKPLPTRFREHLATVCESHHKEDLHKVDKSPLFQPYGNHAAETANVQYAAIMLRTVDLLHVTKDRTPSIMYKTLRLSDPKGVDEWKKQQGTFSVRMKTREFDPNDLDSHIISISADFSEERPYFVLAEYLIYAEEQITLSKRWVEGSQKYGDAKNYWFPWHSVKGSVLVEGNEPVQINFELDRGRLLDLLVGHTIYNDPTVAVRELLQNAIDAVRYQNYRDKKAADEEGNEEPPMGKVVVYWDSETRELIVEDNGIGMDLDTIKFHLLRVGLSYYNTPQFEAENSGFSPISRFGIGVLTCFMISDDIEIITCRQSAQNSLGYRIRMTSVHAEYLLKRLESGHPELKGLEPHGTRVRLRLRETVDLSERSIPDILRYWVILPACHVVYVEGESEPQRIGFDTCVEALRYFHSGEYEGDRMGSISYEILEAPSRHEEEQSYDLAFMVRNAWTPEQNFVLNRNENAPAVCLEGIRVDNHLPGYDVRDRSDYPGSRRSLNICALLSVRGNKNFRTTVSRSDLERDREYFRVAEICTELLFEHVKGEVRRISEKVGKPLSQASTAGQWIYGMLLQNISNKRVRNFIYNLYIDLPSIVVEKIYINGNNIETHRNLLSQNELAKIERFWTIESRLSDYLGSISRDLGRELSLNNFLGALAPELQKPDITPVISDAHQFKEQITSSHCVKKAYFSRQNQQTMLEWEKVSVKRDYRKFLAQFNIDIERVNSIVSKFEDEMDMGEFEERKFRGFSDVREFLEIVEKIGGELVVAPIDGDVEDVIGVRTRIITVVSPESTVGEKMTKFNLKIDNYMDTICHEKIYYFISILWIYISTIGLLSRSLGIRRKRERSESLSHNWKALLNSSTDFMTDEEIEKLLVNWDDVVNCGMLFDASDYWRNWDRMDEF